MHNPFHFTTLNKESEEINKFMKFYPSPSIGIRK